MSQNCWEYKKCGRQPGGEKASELGVCTAAECIAANGINSGRNGGRACWAVAGTLCGGKVQGSFVEKQANCAVCDFYKKVRAEEGSKFVKAGDILKRVKLKNVV